MRTNVEAVPRPAGWWHGQLWRRSRPWRRAWLRPVTSVFAVALGATGVVLGRLAPASQEAVAQWASTSVANLVHHPFGSIPASAVVSTGNRAGWVALGALGLLAAERAVGSRRLLAAVVAAHVLGTLISEGIVAWRVAHGSLPVGERTILDVGPSYVVVAGLTIGLLRGSWPGRATAVLGFWLLGPDLFEGLGALDVTAVGHLVSVAVGVLVGATYRSPRPLPETGSGRGG